DLQTGARCRRGGGSGLALAEGYRPGRWPPSVERLAIGVGPRATVRFAARRSRTRERPAPADLRSRGRRPSVPALHRPRSAGDRGIVSRRGVASLLGAALSGAAGPEALV